MFILIVNLKTNFHKNQLHEPMEFIGLGRVEAFLGVERIKPTWSKTGWFGLGHWVMCCFKKIIKPKRCHTT